MPSGKKKQNEVDQYIARFPAGTQEALEQIRAAIKKAAPEAAEMISYQMPAYKYQGMLVYFAGYAKHIGFYPMPSAIQKFATEIAGLKSAKGSVQFPLSQPMPLALVDKIVWFRLKENQAKAAKSQLRTGPPAK